MSWLDKYFSTGIHGVASDGVGLAPQPVLDFGSGLLATADPISGTINISVPETGALVGALVNALRAQIGTIDGEISHLKGFTTPGDGGEGTFRWSTGTAVDNGGTIFNKNGFGNSAAGYWKRIFSGARDVRWYGAVLDGLTDDHTSFTRAIADANGDGSVLVPGTAALYSQLDFTSVSFVHLFGLPGSQLIFTVTDIALGGGTVTGCTVSDLVITGTGARMVAFSSATRVVLRNLNVSGATLDGASHTPAGIWMASSTDCTIEGCFVYSNGRQKVYTADSGTDTFTSSGHGFLNNDQVHVFSVGGTLAAGLVAGTDYHVVNKTTDTFQLSATEGGSPINITTNGSGTQKVSLLVVDIFGDFSGHTRLHVRGNSCISDATIVGIGIENAVDSEVSGNLVQNTAGSGANDGYGILISQTTTSDRVAVTGNVVRSVAGSGIYFRGSAHCTATGNVVSNCCLTQDDTTLNVAGIAATNGPHSIVGNLILSSTKSGISWSGAVTVVGNTVDTVTKEGIWCRGSASGSVIVGNRVLSAGVRGILSETAVANIQCSNNLIQSSGNNGIEFTAGISGGTVSGNMITSAGAKGIVVDGGSYVEVTSNTCINCGDTSIYLTATHTDASHNSCTGGTGKGLLCTGNYCRVIANDLSGNSSSGYTLGGTNTQAFGNRFSTGPLNGIATLNGTTAVTVTTGEVITADFIQLTRKTKGTLPGHFYVNSISNATSFDVKSDSATDDADIFWEIVH